jgi:hypothetical protein
MASNVFSNTCGTGSESLRRLKRLYGPRVGKDGKLWGNESRLQLAMPVKHERQGIWRILKLHCVFHDVMNRIGALHVLFWCMEGLGMGAQRRGSESKDIGLTRARRASYSNDFLMKKCRYCTWYSR